MSRSSFTLIELLVVIAILAILSVTVVFVLNPSDLIKQSRDSTRLTDLNNLNKALGLFQVTNPGSFQGTSTVVYVSIPDTTTTCANLGLPTLPAGYTYSCVATSTLAKNDGTGWIPVNFSAISYGSIISRLPIDPINSTSTSEYYTYTPGGSWELNAVLTSDKYKYNVSIHKENMPGVLAVGSDLKLSPIYNTGGLAARYSLAQEDLLTASTIKDMSGNNRTGTITAGASSGFQPNQRKKANQAYDFDAANTKIDTGSDWIGAGASTTISAWVYLDSYGEGNSIGTIIDNGTTSMYIQNNSRAYFTVSGNVSFSNAVISTKNWYHIGITRNGATIAFYINGVNETSDATAASPVAGTTNLIIGNNAIQTKTFDGKISDLRVFNRVLSLSEIRGIYNSTR